MAANNTKIVLTAEDKTRQAFDAAKKNLAGLESAAGTASRALAGIGAGLSVAGLAAFVKKSIDAADNMRDLAIATGTSVQSLASLELASKQSGTNLEALAKGMGKLSVFMAQNADEAKRLGITAQDPAQALAQLADALERAATPADRNAIAAKALGKNYAELMPLLTQGGDELRRQAADSESYAKQMTAMADQADQFNDSLAKLQQGLSLFGMTVGNAVLPTLNKMFVNMEEGIRIFGSFGDALLKIGLQTNPFDSVTDGLAKYRAEIKRLRELQAGSRPEIAAMLEPQIKDAEKKLEWYKHLQRQEALALGAPYADYKMPKRAPGTLGYSDVFGGSKPGKSSKTGKTASRMSDAEWAMEESAHLTRTLHQIGQEADAQMAAAFERGVDAAEEFEAAQARVRQGLEASRDELINLIDPVQKYRVELDKVDTLLQNGLITPEQATAARLHWQEQIDQVAGFGEEAKKQINEMDEFMRNAAKGFQDSLADFLFDPFKDGLDGMLEGFGNLLRRMAAQAIAADITRAIFGDQKTGGGALAGMAGMFGSSTGGSDQNILGQFASLFGFASGGSFKVAGSGGTDSQLVAFKATPGEEVIVRTPQQQQSAGTVNRNVIVNMHVSATDAASFQRSRGQVSADLAAAVQGARRYA